MTHEKHRDELDERTLEAAAGGKPWHVIVPDVDKIRGDKQASGGLTEGGDCGGGIKTLDDIELVQVRGGLSTPGGDVKRDERRQSDEGERAELPWV